MVFCLASWQQRPGFLGTGGGVGAAKNQNSYFLLLIFLLRLFHESLTLSTKVAF